MNDRKKFLIIVLGVILIFLVMGFYYFESVNAVQTGGTGITNMEIIPHDLTVTGTHYLSKVDVNGDIFVRGDGNFIGNFNVEGSIGLTDAQVFSDGSTQETASTPNDNIWHVTTAVLKQSASTAAQDTSPRDIHFKPDGTKVFISGVAGDGIIYEYDFTIPWDTSTINYNSNYLNVDTYESNPMGLFFRHDGKKMYVSGSSGEEINEFDLTTAWDVSTGEWKQLYDVSGEETQPAGVEFKPDGFKMYIIGTSSNSVNEYDLNIAWDISTAEWNQAFGTDINNATGFKFKTDGTKMYVMDGSTEDDVQEYNLSTPWDISTARLERRFNVANENAVPQDIAFNPTGMKMYMMGSQSPATLFEYDLGFISLGKVVIGIIDPTEKLEINGNVSISGDANAFDYFVGSKSIVELESPTPYGVDNTGLIGYWSGNGNAKDYSGYGRDGTLAGDANYSDGVFGTGFEFDGAGDSVDMGDVDEYEFDSNFSVSAWVKFPNLSDTSTVVSKGGGTPNGWALNFSSGEQPSIVTNSQSAQGSALTINEWHHIVGLYDGTKLLLYVNGSLVDNQTTAITQNTIKVFSIGSQNGAQSQHFTGSVDEVLLFNRTLSAKEIQALYNAGNKFKTSGNSLYYDGHVGIGKTNPTRNFEIKDTSEEYVLKIQDSSDECDFGITSMGWTFGCLSDERVKEDISEIDKNKKQSISEWIFNYPLKEYTLKSNGERQIGVIAQEIQALNPSKVKDMVIFNEETNQEEKFLAVEVPTTTDLILTIQQLNKRVGTLQGELCNKDNSYSWCNQLEE